MFIKNLQVNTITREILIVHYVKFTLRSRIYEPLVVGDRRVLDNTRTGCL